MNWVLLASGFGLGTFKFLFAHWMVYWGFEYKGFETLVEIFISVTAGAWVVMGIFYFASEYFMKRSATKRKKRIDLALESGIPFKKKKIFTRTNKLIVWIKRIVGIYGFTLLAPLFLSIPGGAIICAKFYGNKKKTFPLMLFFTTAYSALMCVIIFAIQ